jgi:DUF1680 family protein
MAPACRAQGVTAPVNGRKQNTETAPGSYFTLQREWRDGDRVEIRLPMSPHSEFLRGTTNVVAVLYGPIVTHPHPPASATVM